MNRREEKAIKYISIAATIFFAVWGILAVYSKNAEFIFDRFFTAVISLFILLMFKRMHLRLPVIIFGLCTIILHHLKLYGNIYFGIPFDRIMHFIGAAAIAMIFYQYYYNKLEKKGQFFISISSALISVGISSMMEVVEFIGYSFLGQGEGLLFYGTGDFGEYNNTAWDLLSNTIGAISAGILMSLFYSYFSKIDIKFKITKQHKKYLKTAAVIILIMTFSIFISIFIYRTLPYTQKIDPYDSYDFNYVLDAASINKTEYIGNLTKIIAADNSNFAKGDAYLILGRLAKNPSLICSSVDFYSIVEESLEEKALAYETIASLKCKKGDEEYYLKASKIWQILENEFRAELDRKLANNERIDVEYKNDEPFSKTDAPHNPSASAIIIGTSKIELDKDSVLVSQTDRVSRDWLSFQLQHPFSKNLLTVFSERSSYSQSELLPDIGWHEGARIKEMAKAGFDLKIASGTIAAKINNKWYAPDETGVFRFEILEDKIYYPTTRFLAPNIALIIDTHGINTIVEQAVRYNATAVIGCCDHPGKINAAKYLSNKGIKVICLTDRFVPDILFSEADVLGSPPIKANEDKSVLGDQPIVIGKNDKIIVMGVNSSAYGIQYYDTPARYFRNLNSFVDLNIIYFDITDFNKMNELIEKAEKEKATVIAVRIFNSNDYLAVKEWLEKNKKNKAILFHSVSYPYGYKLLKEFPRQTSFDDINPIII